MSAQQRRIRALNPYSRGNVGRELKAWECYTAPGVPFEIPTASSHLGGTALPMGHNPGGGWDATNDVTSMPQGAGFDARIGKQVNLKSMELKGVIFCQGAEQLGNVQGAVISEVAIWVVLMHNPNGTLIDEQAVFTNPTDFLGTRTVPLRNLNGTNEYTVLKKIVIKPTDFRVLAMGNPAWAYDLLTHTSGGGPTLSDQLGSVSAYGAPFECHINLKGITSKYLIGATQQGYTGADTNSIYVLATNAGTPMPQYCVAMTRLRYTDA